MNDQILLFLERNFAIQPQGDALTHEELLQRLKERVLLMLRSDMDKLVQACYRIDLSDHDVDLAFNLGEVHKIATRLSELILERQIKKLQYRNLKS